MDSVLLPWRCYSTQLIPVTHHAPSHCSVETNIVQCLHQQDGAKWRRQNTEAAPKNAPQGCGCICWVGKSGRANRCLSHPATTPRAKSYVTQPCNSGPTDDNERMTQSHTPASHLLRSTTILHESTHISNGQQPHCSTKPPINKLACAAFFCNTALTSPLRCVVHVHTSQPPDAQQQPRAS